MTRSTSVFFAAALLACSPTSTAASTSHPTAPASAPIVPAVLADTPPPRPAIPAASADPDAKIVCNFAWRKDVSSSFRKADQKRIELDRRSGRSDFTLGELAIELRHDLDAAKDPGLQIAIAGRKGNAVLADRYVFADGSLPENLPPSGHGFTGLAYVTPPDGSGELQFQCVVARPGDTVVDDGWVVGRPGTPVAAGRHVVCTFDLDDGKRTSKRIALDDRVALGVNAAREGSAKLGPFVISVMHMPGGHDSGGVFVDVAVDAGASARAFYQVHGDELPADFTAKHTGFTGIHTHHASTATLSYVCSTEA